MQEPPRAARICEEAAIRAADGGDETGASLARAMAVFYRLIVTPGSADELETLLLDARRRLEEAEDHAGLAQIWWALGFGVANSRGRADDWATASLQAQYHRRVAGRSGPSADIGIALVIGSRPADEALEVVDRLLAETPSAWLLLNRAWLLAMLERNDEAWRIATDANVKLREQSDARWGEWILAELSTLAGDHEDASNRLRILCEWIEAVEQRAYLDYYLARLGRSLCPLGRFDEAEQFAELARALEKEGDPKSGARCWPGSTRTAASWQRPRGWRGMRWLRASENRSLDDQCLALWDLAEVLAVWGRADEAAEALEQALDRCRRKKNLALTSQVVARI